MCDSGVIRAWEECVVVPERGSRIVHYKLKDNIGNSVVAVVGRERCINHMVYTVSEDYLRVFGSTGGVYAGKKWQARREVVDWLITVVARGGPIVASSISRQSYNAQATAEKVKRPIPEKYPLQTSKRVKRCRLSEILHSNCTSKTDLTSDNRAVKWEPTCNRVRINLPMKRAILALRAPEPPCKILPKFNKNIELLSQDSGMRGCWFRCRILLSSKSRLKVQYKDVLQADGVQKLEEWVTESRVADPDKLGIRCLGRLTIRPRPCMDSSDTTFVVGAAVDVWWCNSWWEGVVIGYETPTNTNLQVYFPGENRFSTVARKHMRVSRDWIDSKWVNIEGRHDILSFLSSIFSPGSNLTPQAAFVEANSSAANSMVATHRKHEGDKWKIPSSTDGETLNFKKRLINRYNEEVMKSGRL
ncbi:hypothetical protein SASPL_117422 [Salvia splendens]|uniref:Agenet domain-containing protein n=1 Tax=Salvia splendens TaxID=180675 RepID=A0A8X8XVG3_SALSN|nr:uncharacterized protein LOC121806624 [Salvia splendens]XP_042062676.1 uncharacterized protein LOC121806624 [Salvia splendens]KAG6420878.1 hypothetical protein SASPL_117422 [Salvia splendens]